MSYRINLSGQRFGKLIVLGYDSNAKRSSWICRCDCGTIYSVNTSNLRSGKTLQCKNCRNKTVAQKRTKHGMRNTKLYNVWCNMRRRCFEHNNPRFPQYGGRGISVCEQWLGEQGFANFAQWAYSNGYIESDNNRTRCTLDRINSDGNYCPENCRWTNIETQSNNKTNTHLINDNGELLSVAEFSRKYNVSYRNVYNRLYRGCTDVETLKKPPCDMTSSNNRHL